VLAASLDLGAEACFAHVHGQESIEQSSVGCTGESYALGYARGAGRASHENPLILSEISSAPPGIRTLNLRIKNSDPTVHGVPYRPLTCTSVARHVHRVPLGPPSDAANRGAVSGELSNALDGLP
jgi:hypothetical protein